MATSNQTKQSEGRKRELPLLWIAFALVVLIVAVIYFLRIRSQLTFQLQDGDRELLVLIRNENEGVYQVRYEGREPAQLESLKVILGGQILHVDVVQVLVDYGGREIVLIQPSGEFPAGEEITLQPGDTFETRVTFRGQSLGGNYFKGYRVEYSIDGQTSTYDMEVENEYAIQVE